MVLTIPEAKRMVAETGLKPEDFLEFTANIDSKGTPHYPLLVRRGWAVEEYFIILKRRHKTTCVFLEEDLRCSVYAHRPAVCRLYPFEFDAKKPKKGALCPVKFEMDKGTGKVADQLLEDLAKHGKIAREWHQKFGKEAPDMKRFAEYFL